MILLFWLQNARQVGRRILEQVAKTRGLLSCLQFLCSCSTSISSVFLGLKHARELVKFFVLSNCQQSAYMFFYTVMLVACLINFKIILIG